MIYSYSKRIPRCKPLNAASFHRDGLTEKAIEDLLASNPGLLFSNPEDVLLVGRQRHGSRLPDLLFLDGARNLYVVEIKRDSADRTCVAQVQEYGARLGDWTREDFENLWKGLHRKTPLAKGLRDHLGFGLTEPIARNVKLVIVAQSPGPGIADLIDWLHENGLSIHFVPFALYRLGERRFFEMTPIRASRAARAASSNWYLNTNETFRQGSSQDMFHQGIAALAGFGPKDGRKMLAEPGPGARVFAYANGHGYVGVGRFRDGEARTPRRPLWPELSYEYHREVDWYIQLGSLKQAVAASTVRRLGFKCPARGRTLMQIRDAEAADHIENQLKRRQRREA